MPGLAYHLAYASRGTDEAGKHRETGFAAALTSAATLGHVAVAPILEWVRFNDRNGTSGIHVTYLTAGIRIAWESWNVALSRTARETEQNGSVDLDDSLIQISAGHAFDNGIGLNAGYRQSEESGLVTGTYGFLVDYIVIF